MNVSTGLVATISHAFDEAKTMKVKLNHLHKILDGMITHYASWQEK